MVFKKRKPELVGQDGWQCDGDRLHPIKSAATRIAACCRVKDMVDPTPQDLGRLRASPDLKVVGVEKLHHLPGHGPVPRMNCRAATSGKTRWICGAGPCTRR